VRHTGTWGSISLRSIAVANNGQVAVRQMHHRIKQSVSAWWYGGPMPSRRWRVYVWYHIVLVLLLGVFASWDSPGHYLEDWLEHFPSGLRFLLYCVLAIVYWPSVVLAYVAPFLSLRLLWLARRGSPAFAALALCDSVTTLLQYLAFLVLC